MNNFEWWVIEQKTQAEILQVLREHVPERPWAAFFLNDHPLNPGNLNSVCRIGFVPFAQCIQDRFFYVDKARHPEILAAGGITSQFCWDSKPEHLPAGWQGVVRQSYVDARSGGRIPNAMVGLLAFTVPRFRERGMSGKVLTKMCTLAHQRGYRYLLVPALPPAQFEKEHVRTPMEAISQLKREDGEYYDYWIRLHTRKGATIIGTCAQSHRFVFSLEDFSEQVSSDPITTTGEHVVRLDKDQVLGPNRKNMWQVVYADVERSLVTFNWGCVWVQYDLQALRLDSVE